MDMYKLYGKDSKGNIKEWTVSTQGSVITVTHGKLGGKMQQKLTTCVGKNIGKANETTPEQQAELEAISKYKKQLDKLYKTSIEDLEDVEKQLPMLALDYTKAGHRIKYPCYVSPKLDGVRCFASCDGINVTLMSRLGKYFQVPIHIHEEILYLHQQTGITLFDGELYTHGEKLQNIVSCVMKENEMTGRLQFWIFDLPSDKVWAHRYEDLMTLHDHIRPSSCIKLVSNYIADNEFDARQAMNMYLQKGFEGMMLRNSEGLYKYNHRSPDLMKWKDFQDAEALVVGVTKDKNGEGVLKCKMPSGVYFECKMVGNKEYRLFSNMLNLVGSWITYKYQALTEDGVPQFPVGLNERNCESDGTPTL
ncbi:ATP-dependent DNA ligase [Trabzonvirus APT65]|uniref:DNA ligase n=1 Tax=Aeromonas phage APT65 TaxID=2982914 RepID=A0A9E8GH16_9CAUD|nr:ATP-dependent DNA ligase [Aeromonas phage APT65]